MMLFLQFVHLVLILLPRCELDLRLRRLVLVLFVPTLLMMLFLQSITVVLILVPCWLQLDLRLRRLTLRVLDRGHTFSEHLCHRYLLSHPRRDVLFVCDSLFTRASSAIGEFAGSTSEDALA